MTYRVVSVFKARQMKDFLGLPYSIYRKDPNWVPPFSSEVRRILDVRRPRTEKVNIVGPVCFASDVVYRNKLMPRVHPKEVMAIMDSGAYFTALESSFGFARPAIVSVNDQGHRLIRRAEVFEDMVYRDSLNQSAKTKEV